MCNLFSLQSFINLYDHDLISAFVAEVVLILCSNIIWPIEMFMFLFQHISYNEISWLVEMKRVPGSGSGSVRSGCFQDPDPDETFVKIRIRIRMKNFQTSRLKTSVLVLFRDNLWLKYQNFGGAPRRFYQWYIYICYVFFVVSTT